MSERMTTPRTCHRGHLITGPNAVTSKGRSSDRCKACKRAVDNVRKNPDRLPHILQISNDAYAAIMKGPVATPLKKRDKPAPPKNGHIELREVERLMPNGVKRWMIRALEEQLQPADLPPVIQSWLESYGFIFNSPRTKALAFNERGRKMMRQLNVRLKGRN